LYSTPLKSDIDKNKASFLLSLLIKPEEKIKFAFCSDLIIENSLHNPTNEHYFYDPLIEEFWSNYNHNRMYLYHTIMKNSKFDLSMLNDCLNGVRDLDSINRSSLLFLSNNLSRGHKYFSRIESTLIPADLNNLFLRTNLVQDYRSIESFQPDDCFTVLECLVKDSQLHSNFAYFNRVIRGCERVCVITDNELFKCFFKNKKNINDKYYLCYDKEIK
jgi:hypothetical protein